MPGPRPLPLIGNIGAFNKHKPFFPLYELAQQYGPIFQLKLGPRNFISVNDPRIAKELFERRGSLYNSRNSPHVGHIMLSDRRRIAFVEHGPAHTAYRKQMHLSLSISKTRDNQAFQEMESRQVLHDLLGVVDDAKLGRQDSGRIQQIFR